LKEQGYDSHTINMFPAIHCPICRNLTLQAYVGLLAYYSYKWEAIDQVGLKLSTMKDTDLCI